MSETIREGVPEQRPAGVQSLERALDILEVLGRSDEGLGVSEIGDEVGLANGTVHRLLATLTYRGYTRQNPRGRKYTLGVKTLLLGSSARERLGPLSQPYLKELMEASGESANLATLEKSSVVYLEQVPSPRMVRMFTEPGNRVAPHSSGTGKVLLAYQPAHLVDSTIRQTGLARFTKHTIIEPERLKEELARIRVQGYALDSEEMEEGVHCLAAPVFGSDGSIVAALSISGPVGRLGDNKLEELIPLIKRIAEDFSVTLSQTTLD